MLQNPPTHKLDIWLPRLANFTQVALLLLTTAGFYLTVLPLYQKALLDEAFARKEVELKHVTASLEAKYVKLRRVAVHGFITYAEMDCSGLGEIMLKKAGEKVDRTQPFTIDVKKCLVDYEVASIGLSELRTDDRVFFRTEVAKIADEIAKLQADAALNYRRAEQDINDGNMEAYASKREFSAQALKFLAQHMTPEQVAARKRLDAVEELRRQRVDGYWNAFRTGLRSLANLTWPKQTH